MYIIYESYSDDYINDNGLITNTKIIGLYKNKKSAKKEYKKIVDNTISSYDNKFDWFLEDVDIKILDNKRIINACRLHNGEFNSCVDCYMIILEKVKVVKSDK